MPDDSTNLLLAALVTCTLDAGEATAFGLGRSVVVVVVVLIVVGSTAGTAVHDAPLALGAAIRAVCPHVGGELGAFHMADNDERRTVGGGLPGRADRSPGGEPVGTLGLQWLLCPARDGNSQIGWWVVGDRGCFVGRSGLATTMREFWRRKSRFTELRVHFWARQTSATKADLIPPLHAHTEFEWRGSGAMCRRMIGRRVHSTHSRTHVASLRRINTPRRAFLTFPSLVCSPHAQRGT